MEPPAVILPRTQPPAAHHAICGLAGDVEHLVILELARLGAAVEQVCGKATVASTVRTGRRSDSKPRSVWCGGRPACCDRGLPATLPLAVVPREEKAATGAMAGAGQTV